MATAHFIGAESFKMATSHSSVLALLACWCCQSGGPSWVHLNHAQWMPGMWMSCVCHLASELWPTPQLQSVLARQPHTLWVMHVITAALQHRIVNIKYNTFKRRPQWSLQLPHFLIGQSQVCGPVHLEILSAHLPNTLCGHHDTSSCSILSVGSTAVAVHTKHVPRAERRKVISTRIADFTGMALFSS